MGAFYRLLCLRRQTLQKINISNTVAFLGYFYYIYHQVVALKTYPFSSCKKARHLMPCFFMINELPYSILGLISLIKMETSTNRAASVTLGISGAIYLHDPTTIIG